MRSGAHRACVRSALPGSTGLICEVTAANNAKLLASLVGVADDARTARYRCSLVLARPDGSELVASGVVTGRILRVARGTNGFGYDPLFLSAELGETFGEAGEAAKHAVSHRGRAVDGAPPVAGLDLRARGVAQSGSASALGAEGPGFKSRRPDDQSTSPATLPGVPEFLVTSPARTRWPRLTDTASLQHPHILSLFDLGAADGFRFDVMPDIQGETLRQKLEREPVALNDPRG